MTRVRLRDKGQVNYLLLKSTSGYWTSSVSILTPPPLSLHFSTEYARSRVTAVSQTDPGWRPSDHSRSSQPTGSREIFQVVCLFSTNVCSIRLSRAQQGPECSNQPEAGDSGDHANTWQQTLADPPPTAFGLMRAVSY